MMAFDPTHAPATDPASLYRYRDSLYAADLLFVAVVWLDLFSWLAQNPSDLHQVAQHFETTERPTDVMLTLFVAMGLLERRGAHFHVTAVAREHLCAGSPWFLGPSYALGKERPACRDLLRVLRTGKPASWNNEPDTRDWHKAMETEEFASQFTAGMDCRGIYLAQAAAKTLSLDSRHRLLDIAGGSGIYACSMCAHFVGLKATVLEKPPVDRVARSAIAKRGFGDRVAVIAGDMLTEPLPRDFDVHLFSNVLHDWDLPVVERLLAASFVALAPGGLLVIHDTHLNADKTGPLAVAEYSTFLMQMTEGRSYGVGEINQSLLRAGFSDLTFASTVAARSVITAQKPI